MEDEQYKTIKGILIGMFFLALGNFLLTITILLKIIFGVK
jgi:hypothetical protein